MTDPQIDNATTAIIETTRHLARSLVAKVEAMGVDHADATIALAYALHDAATALTGSEAAGIEWMRTATDHMERQLLEAENDRARKAH